MRCKSISFDDFFRDNSFHMADVGGKIAGFRRAIACGSIKIGKKALELIINNQLPKGDVLKLAEIAGINGAKQASHTIPLCHPLVIDFVGVNLRVEKNDEAITAYCVVSTVAKTGVEMEALAGVNAALLTIYDLTKPVEPALTINNIRLLMKEGGKKGLWLHPEGIPEELNEFLPQNYQLPLKNIKAAVITMSDRASRGEYEDKSGRLMCELIQHEGAEIVHYEVLPDNAEALSKLILKLCDQAVQLVFTTGGTGLANTDITPETLENIFDKPVPGIAELLREFGARYIKYSWLSRSTAGIKDKTLIISVPGSTGAVKESIAALKEILPHALELISASHSSHGH